MNYKRVLLKISGEALMGEKSFGQDFNTIKQIANDIKQVHDLGIEVCAVVGGGNIYRGIQGANIGMDRASSDNMGMLATLINALALQNMLESIGINTRVQSAIPMTSICEPFIRRRADRHMEKGRVVIFGAGTGNPYFTTDSAAALRAIEMRCDLLLKATQVDGVYDSDPVKNNEAKRFDLVSYDEVLQRNLNVMDMAAIALARENSLPIKIFSIKEPGNFLKVLNGSGTCTTISL